MPYSAWAETLRNLCINPGFENGMTGWSSSGGVSGVSDGGWSASGTKSAKVEMAGGNNSGDIRIQGTSASVFYPGIGPGDTITIAATLNMLEVLEDYSVASNSRQPRILLWYSTDGSSWTEAFGTKADNIAGQQRISYTFNIPSDATGLLIGLGCAGGTAANDGKVIYWDDVVVVKGTVDPGRLDGDMLDEDLVRFSWAGTSGSSQTIMEERSFTYPAVAPRTKPLAPEDILVEFRDKNLIRQGSIPVDDLRLKMQPVVNGVGSWSLTLPAEHRAVPYLRTPGAGILVTNLRTGETLLSGPTSKPSKRATSADPEGMVTVAGLTDDRLLWDSLAFPNPAIADPLASSQSRANDVRTAKGETLMRMYVAYNICYTHAQAGRLGGFRSKLRLETPDKGLGFSTTRRPRFDRLGDLLVGIAAEQGLAFRVVQIGAELQFQVYQPTDRTSTIRLDIKNGTLQEQNVEFAPPEVTRMVVAGQGEGVERRFLQMSTADSTSAEAEWGLIIEEFKDQRNTDVESELEAAALERLNEAGFTKIAVKATPANETTMIFMKDFFLGDKVSVVIDGQEQPNSHITEAAIVVDSTGIRTAVAIGDIADFDSDSALRQTVSDTQRRIDNLERNAEIGSGIVTWSDIENKPSAFPPSAHIHTWGDISDPKAHVISSSVSFTDPPSAYPPGVSVAQITGSGWPGGVTVGTVVTFRHSAFRQSQHFYDRTNPLRMYVRTSNGDDRWNTSGFQQIYTSGAGVPWADIADVPSSFPPSTHGHSLTDSNITGVLPSSQMPSASTSSKGAVELATSAEAGSGTDTSRAVTPAALKAAMLEMVYPVGSIFISTVNVSPASSLGGTWVPWGAGRVPVGVDTTQTEFNTVEKTGGSKTHTLSVSEIPAHSHPQRVTAIPGSGGTGVRQDYASDGTGLSAYTQGINTSDAGGGGAHNNMQPYITAYMFKRTA